MSFELVLPSGGVFRVEDTRWLTCNWCPGDRVYYVDAANPHRSSAVAELRSRLAAAETHVMRLRQIVKAEEQAAEENSP